MKTVFSFSYQAFETQILEKMRDLEEQGKVIRDQRNKIFQIKIDDFLLAVKAFKRPNLFNRVVYRYFRRSKAERSFIFAQRLSELGIHTPESVAYFEAKGFLFGDSYYISRYLDYDHTFREVPELTDMKKRNEILKQFTAFTYRLHERCIEFLDHSGGNTLIVDQGGGKFDFYVVDLNRMRFHSRPLSFSVRMRNFARLTREKEIIKEMSRTYALLTGKDFEVVFARMWRETENFLKKINRKQKLKSIFQINRLKTQ